MKRRTNAASRYTSARMLLVILLLAIPHASQANDAQQHGSPGAIFSEGTGPGSNLPLWISVEELTARGERLETTKLLGFTRSLIAFSEKIQRKRRAHSLAESTCPVFRGYSVFERRDERSVHSLQDATETSLAVLTGRIAHTETGFMLGVPNTLLTLSDISVLSNKGRLELSAPLYVPLHRANFSFDGFSFCAQALYSRKMYNPSIEDRVMVFVLDPPTRNLLLTHPDQVIILPRGDSKPLLPPHLLADPAVSENPTQGELLAAVLTLSDKR